MRSTILKQRFGLLVGPLLVFGLCSAPAEAQGGPVKSGIKGRVVIAPSLKTAPTVPVDDADLEAARTAANVRRPSGHGPLGGLRKPAPDLLVVIEGVKQKSQGPRTLHIRGMRFEPSGLLLLRPDRLKIYNDMKTPLTVVSGGSSTPIGPGEQAFVEVPDGESKISLKEMPWAVANVRALPEAIELPVRDSGLIDDVPIEGGDYKLGFYSGGTPLLIKEIRIPDSEFIAFDATISENRVVTVSIKDGGLKAIRTPTPRPPPKPPKPPPEGEPPAPDSDNGG